MTQPLALYVHWPWCKKKCPYCDFNSHVNPQHDEAAYKNALLAELHTLKKEVGERSLTSIFFGGGTPSLMSDKTVSDVLLTSQKLFGFDTDIEITLEANPTSSEAQKFKKFAAAGINRLSVGVQSITPAHLSFLGREHSADEALQTIEAAFSAFTNVNMDLIYGLPQQTLSDWQTQLETAARFNTPHISCYQLTIEPNTAFFGQHKKGVFTMPDDDTQADFYALTNDFLAQHGYRHYEVSNYAHAGKACRHNSHVWQYGDYMGIGAGAHGRITTANGIHKATRNYKMPERYMEAVYSQGTGRFDAPETTPRLRTEERLMMGLRLAEGVEATLLDEAYMNTKGLHLMQKMGFVEKAAGYLRLTPQGRPLLDGVLAQLLDD